MTPADRPTRTAPCPLIAQGTTTSTYEGKVGRAVAVGNGVLVGCGVKVAWPGNSVSVAVGVWLGVALSTGDPASQLGPEMELLMSVTLAVRARARPFRLTPSTNVI